MRNGFTSNHWLHDGKPSGGSTFGTGFAISWQNGPLGRGADRIDPNGAFVEDVIDAALDRIAFYQSGDFACHENEEAMRYLKTALAALESRTKSRESRGVEGMYKV